MSWKKHLVNVTVVTNLLTRSHQVQQWSCGAVTCRYLIQYNMSIIIGTERVFRRAGY